VYTLDLFAGVGGVRLGFDNAGFKCSFANDIEPKTKITYDLNHDKPKLHIEDINDISIDGLPHFDVLCGGFPCQTFSVAGKRLGFNDEAKGTLFFHLAEILRIRKPKAFFLENVKNLLNHDNGATFDVIKRIVAGLGYNLHYKVLKSSNYGVPQGRERIFLVGFKDDVPFEFPEYIPLQNKVEDIIGDSEDESLYIRPGHKFYEPIIAGVTKTDTVYQWRRNYLRENKSKVCPTLTAQMMGCLNLVRVKDGVRMLTAREMFRFQGFPDSFQLPEELSYKDLHHQVGNSVSVPVVEAVAKQMMKALNETN
jgi:DNA (cytosine-5)-methyltransferase 1